MERETLGGKNQLVFQKYSSAHNSVSLNFCGSIVSHTLRSSRSSILYGYVFTFSCFAFVSSVFSNCGLDPLLGQDID